MFLNSLKILVDTPVSTSQHILTQRSFSDEKLISPKYQKDHTTYSTVSNKPKVIKRVNKYNTRLMKKKTRSKKNY